jgi:hypothetical protein
MAVEVKVAPDNRLELKSVFLEDRRVTSQYFNLTELPDTFTGGKNAFLIAGTDYLEPNTEVLVQIRDSTGRVVYTESSDGSPEYYEGISKVIAVYVYPTDSVAQAIDSTAFGPCTITILGELKYYDNDGSKTEVPEIWKGKYNIRYVGTANINPTLANTTRVRFFLRPRATITELLKPIYNVSGSAITASAIIASYANIKLSRLETFAGDVKRVKVYRSSVGTVSDFELIQDIQIESKELLQTFEATGSVVTDTGFFNVEVLSNFWNTGSLSTQLNTTQFSGSTAVKLNGNGNFSHIPKLDLSDVTVYELAFDAFYTGSSQSNLELHVSGSQNGDVKVDTLTGLFPTKDFTNYISQFTLPKSEPSASLYFKQTQGNWFLKDISLRASSETVFSPNEVSFIISMPTNISNETFNFKFEFFDVNNNYIPVAVTGSQTFTGGNNLPSKILTFESDRTAFRFSSGSFGNPQFQQVGFSISKTNLSGSVTYASAAFDSNGNYIVPASYAGAYPGLLTNAGDSGASLTIANFSGSVSSILVGSITYTASCDGLNEYETIYRFEDGENAPGLFVTANTNQFIYKATDLSLNPSGQTITIEAKRKNLASASTPLTVNSGSGKPPLTFVSTNSTNGVDTYTLAGLSYPYSTSETIYSISGSDQFGNQFSDAIKITPVKILDGLSVSLTNENVTLPALSTGFVASGSFILTSGSVIVKVGGEDIIRNEGLTTNNRFDIISATETNCVANDTTPDDATYGITSLTNDSGSLSLLVRYKDGAGDTTDVTKVVTYSKAKKAAPVVVALFSSDAQAITKTNSGSYGTPSTFTISVNEGGSNYTYDDSVPYANSTFRVSSISGGTNSSGTITPTKPTTDAGTATSVTITYVNSEGTSGTITKTHSVNVTNDGNNGTNGTNGTNGADGGNGPGVVFRGPWSSTTTYYDTDDFPTRRDAVLYNGTYYATNTNATTNLNKQPDTQTSFWESLGTDSFFVAAEIAIFRESYVQNTINVGTNSSGNANITIAGGTTSPYISIGQATKGYNNVGAWIGSDGTSGKLSLKSSTNSLLWDGSSLTIAGALNGATGTFSGALIGGTIEIGSSNSIFKADSSGIYLGNATFGSAPFRVTPAGVLTATNANISGTITASNIIGNTFTNGNNFSVTSTGDLTARNAILTGKVNADSGRFGFGNNFWTINASSIENNVTLNGKVSLNAARPAIEVYDDSGELKVDINGGTEFTSRTGGSINTSGGITGNFQVASDNVANGSSGASYYNSTQITYTGQNLTFTASGANVGKTATLKITALGEAGYSYMEATPSVSLNSISTTYGYLIRKGSNTGTIVATLSNTVANSNAAAGTNSLPDYTDRTFSTSILLEDSIYYIVPFVQNVNLLGYDVGGITTLTGFINTPAVKSATVSFDVGKTEIIAGGMQVIRDTNNYFKVDRGAQSGDIVLIGGKVSVTGSMSLTGDLTANTSSDIRLKTNIQRIPNSMDKILKISGNTFQWLSGFDEIHSHSGNDVGVIAQEIESVLPEIVVTRDNGYKGVHYEKLVALLIEGMKELQSQIDELKNNK